LKVYQLLPPSSGWKSKLSFLLTFAGFLFCLLSHYEDWGTMFVYEVDVHLQDCNGVTAQMVTIPFIGGHLYLSVKKWKVKLPLCLINYAPCHEDVWGSGGIAPQFLTSALDRGERSVPTPLCSQGDNWVGDWVGPRTSLDAVEYRNISCLYWELNPSP
jgi:hypothetical protein